VVQMDVVQDIGLTVNPVQAQGQIEGGSVQGMGLALTENLKFEDGRVCNADWRQYHVPTIVDAPDIHAAFVCHPEPGYPFGWKGIAELPHVQATASVVAAVRNATGLELPVAPASPEAVASVVDDSQARLLTPSTTERLRGPWKVAPPEEPSGPWGSWGSERA